MPSSFNLFSNFISCLISTLGHSQAVIMMRSYMKFLQGPFLSVSLFILKYIPQSCVISTPYQLPMRASNLFPVLLNTLGRTLKWKAFPCCFYNVHMCTKNTIFFLANWIKESDAKKKKDCKLQFSQLLYGVWMLQIDK